MTPKWTESTNCYQKWSRYNSTSGKLSIRMYFGKKVSFHNFYTRIFKYSCFHIQTVIWGIKWPIHFQKVPRKFGILKVIASLMFVVSFISLKTYRYELLQRLAILNYVGINQIYRIAVDRLMISVVIGERKFICLPLKIIKTTTGKMLPNPLITMDLLPDK